MTSSKKPVCCPMKKSSPRSRRAKAQPAIVHGGSRQIASESVGVNPRMILSVSPPERKGTVSVAEGNLVPTWTWTGVLEAALAQRDQTAVIPITTLAPESYQILRDIPAVVEPATDGFIATFFDANISTSGDTEEEAVSNLRSLIVDTFEYLGSEPPDSLGSEPARQLAVLRVFLKRT
jgi:hypothetical protein